MALYFQQLKSYPLIVAANRDEFFSRLSSPPQILLNKPLVFGGKDLVAGGTWLGVNEHGLIAGILNRRVSTEKVQQPLRSRGLLCLDILRAQRPAEAWQFLNREIGSSYQPFNLLFADSEEAYVAYNVREEIQCVKLEKGVHVLSNSAIFDPRSAKLDHAHRLFLGARTQLLEALKPSRGSRSGLSAKQRSPFIQLFKVILSDHTLGTGVKDPKGAICVHSGDYGTVSSTVLFYDLARKRFSYYHASASPCRTHYERLPPVAVL